jgi:hypothetical protein
MTEEERRPGSGPHGWLSDVLIPTLLGGPLTPLVHRLGPRATIDDPLFGRASGLEGVEKLLTELKGWLLAHEARWDKTLLIVGIDRDVADGVLVLKKDGQELTVPAAVVAERRKSREIELRLYHVTRGFRSEAPRPRAPLVPQHSEMSLPRVVIDNLEALRKGDVFALLACFEADATVRDAGGAVHGKADGGLQAFYEKRYGVGRGGGAERLRGGYADDGRSCAVEYTLTHARGEAIPPRPGIAVFERGDSGLIRAIRLYEDDAD